ncbi:MAG: LysR substrate-binding domain-containing protein [Moritella sp.]|uniref:LysR family transcriptional regulator n=1 Tax=Moritella sp. TaxID=78556 RepID=UPI0029A42777|nr:LysR substrate-binding domain-containing protein [Moritella sp.]MDX2319570.1 LysR substrate-binding domain-containing protein [Moritella sp.]
MIQDRASQMVLFHSLVQTGNFTSAALSLAVSVSHVSKQLKCLEADLNVKLVQRSTRSFTLTEAGKQFASYCAEVVSHVQDADVMMTNLQDGVSGVLRLGISQSFGTLHIIPAIEQFRKLHPELQVEVSLFDYKANMIDEGFDLWLTNIEDISEGYVAQRLATTRFVVAASPEYLMHHAAPKHPLDLEHHNCLIYQSRERNYALWPFKQASEELCVNVNGNYRVDLAEAIRDAAISGWGIAYLATYLLTDEFKTGKLIQLLPEWRASQVMQFYAVYPTRKHLPKKITAAITFFKEYIGQPSYWDRQLKAQIKI